jgi:hypothetical protein
MVKLYPLGEQLSSYNLLVVNFLMKHHQNKTKQRDLAAAFLLFLQKKIDLTHSGQQLFE